jgi:hypothetical protein
MKSCSPLIELSRLCLPVLAVALLQSSAQGQATKVDFEKEVWPFINNSCVGCHKAPHEEDGKIKKPKAALRFDAAWAIMAGSENGAILTPGKAEESEMWIRCDLPEDDDDYMPPTGKADPLTDEQKDLLAKWINEGAEFGGWVGNLEGKPKDVSNSGIEIPESKIQTLYNQLAEGVTPLKEDAWASVTEAGGRVMTLSDTSPLLSVDFRLVGEEADDADAGTVKAVADHVAHLDFSKTAVTDAAIEVVGATPRLVRLDLHKTEVGDGALKHLKGLKNLRYLNLYGTQVSDAGLAQLHELKSLENIYIWQSKASEQGVKKLQEALPDAKIIFK